jgi:KaiC/GvpD/RAD55 family RecA-like ATPase
MEEFLADGVVRLDKTVQNFNFVKTVRVEKMRGVKFDEQPRRYVIDERGFTVFHTERVRV